MTCPHFQNPSLLCCFGYGFFDPNTIDASFSLLL
jgi:hypothetical protein